MYYGHWSLPRPPFENVPDSRFLFPTPRHERALATISYSAQQTGEAVLVRGMPGCGKTVLLRALRRTLPADRYRVAFVPNVGCTHVGLLERIAYHLGDAAPGDGGSGGCGRAMFSMLRHVQEADAAAKIVVVMLDDWPQQATDEMLNELRWLMDMDVNESRVRVLIATSHLDHEKTWPQALAQRIFTSTHVEPLGRQQVSEYVTHRLRIAGARDTDIFDSDAADSIARWSGGIPRLINRIANLSMHVTYVDLAKRVTADAVARAAERLGNAPSHSLAESGSALTE